MRKSQIDKPTSMSLKLNTTVLIAFFLLALVPAIAQDEGNLFDFWQYYSDAENTLYKTSCAIGFQQLEQRESEVAALQGDADLLARQKLVKMKLSNLLGPLPAKTPLNAKITGTIEKEDYTVEKILFESIPGFYVTAALFLPRSREGKIPAIIYASGHTDNGFRSDTYQHIIINLVKKGFAVFAFDPVGQGERWQYFNTDHTRRFSSSTIEHSYPGVQCYISGHSPTNYFVWDGIRSIDYLLTRKEIDAERLGMTGRSGGGTQTAYTAAIDDRILAAAPECFITKMEYILKSIGPQDAEQNLYHMISEGLDHADLLEVRAPKPTLMITTTRDFFSIQGARETYQEAKNFYEGLGAGDHVNMVEDDDVHKSTKKNREAMYAFFQKYLNNPGDASDLEVELFSEQDLWVTEQGRVKDLRGQDLFTLNKSVAAQRLNDLMARRENSWDLEELKSTVKELSGFDYPTSGIRSVFSGRTQQPHFALEKYLISSNYSYEIPLQLFQPKNSPSGELILVFHENGMEHVTNSPLIEIMIGQGHAVLIADLPGTGSLGPGYLKGDAYVDNTSFNQWFAGIITGKSLVAIRAEDIVTISNFAEAHLRYDQGVSAISIGSFASELLHAALFDTNIKGIGIIDPFISYAEIAMAPDYQPSFIPSVVAGAIKSYDLPDLMAAFSPRKLMVINPVDPQGAAYSGEQLEGLLHFPDKVYQTSNTAGHWKVSHDLTENQWSEQLAEWFKR